MTLSECHSTAVLELCESGFRGLKGDWILLDTLQALYTVGVSGVWRCCNCWGLPLSTAAVPGWVGRLGVDVDALICPVVQGDINLRCSGSLSWWCAALYMFW